MSAGDVPSAASIQTHRHDRKQRNAVNSDDGRLLRHPAFVNCLIVVRKHDLETNKSQIEIVVLIEWEETYWLTNK